MALEYRSLPILFSRGEAKIVDTWTVNLEQSVHVYTDLTVLATKHMVTVWILEKPMAESKSWFIS